MQAGCVNEWRHNVWSGWPAPPGLTGIQCEDCVRLGPTPTPRGFAICVWCLPPPAMCYGSFLCPYVTAVPCNHIKGWRIEADRGCKTGVEGGFNTSDRVPLNNRNGMSSFITSHSSRYRRSEQPVVTGLIPKLLTAITNGPLVCISASISVYFHVVNSMWLFFSFNFRCILF